MKDITVATLSNSRVLPGKTISYLTLDELKSVPIRGKTVADAVSEAAAKLGNIFFQLELFFST